jgi:AraC-like DNA-binding protein
MSPRSLRRRLAEDGTSWRKLVADLLFERACTRLRDDGGSVREIAEELGYSEASHFTRSFRRMAGISPSAYRREVARAEERLAGP